MEIKHILKVFQTLNLYQIKKKKKTFLGNRKGF